ncbi:unnamed protein product [Adineta steineri]|uniref:Uncharacterized protein n=1 Tax=Adineta steineri TaxID=433720 RepID=A0A819V9F7_9BILA|nr:unnamed protein product [Adineta steineri]CAF4105556.1 unnamed protein product [Adineta steineri]
MENEYNNLYYRFYIPHDLSIDTVGNLRVNDVAMREVFIPGSDPTHFWKPTDVADGYYNSRIIKLYSKGNFLEEYSIIVCFVMEKQMKTVYAFTYYANKHCLYAVSGKNEKNRAVDFTFDDHSESFGHLIATSESNEVRICLENW